MDSRFRGNDISAILGFFNSLLNRQFKKPTGLFVQIPIVFIVLNFELFAGG